MESKRKNVLHQVLSIRGMGQVVTVSAGLLVLCVIFGALNLNFYSGRNIANLLRQIAPFIIVGIGHPMSNNRQHRPFYRFGTGYELHDICDPYDQG